jgi:hypothetical protein
MAESGPPLSTAAELPADLATASAEEITAALSYALRYDERGKPRRAGSEMLARLAAERLTEHLQRAGCVITAPAPGPPAQRRVRRWPAVTWPCGYRSCRWTG